MIFFGTMCSATIVSAHQARLAGSAAKLAKIKHHAAARAKFGKKGGYDLAKFAHHQAKLMHHQAKSKHGEVFILIFTN